MGLLDKIKPVWFGGVKNEITKRPAPSNDIHKKIPFEQQLFRIKQDIQEWRNGIAWAENTVQPNRYNLLRTYKDVVLDAHLSALIQNRKNLTMSREFRFVNEAGEINEDLTKILKTKWFRDFISLSLDAIFWGSSVIQFGDRVENGFAGVELIPRQYTCPEFFVVRETTSGTTGQDWREDPYCNWVVGVGEPKNLGLLMQACPLVLWKKLGIMAWAEYAEIFGVPIRTIKTDIRDDKTRKNAENHLKNMGIASWGVFDTEDIFELVESNRTDAYKIFDALTDRCNSELSKLILGQTGTTDEKAHVGAAEVHERVLEQYGELDKHFCEDVCNAQLLPILKYHGFAVNGLKIEIAENEDLTVIERSKIEIELVKTGKYILTPEYIKSVYGTEVEIAKEPQQKENNFQNEIDKFYS